MRNGGAVLDRGHFEAGSLEGADGGLATGTRALHIDGDLLQAVLHGRLRGGLGGHLRGERRGLTGALEAHGARGLPGDHVALRIGDGDDGVVERRLDVSGAHGNVLTLGALDARTYLLLSHGLLTSLLLLAADLLARTLAGTSVRVRALTANGQAATMTQAAIATDLHEALHVLRNLAVQVALHLEILLDVVAQLREILFREVLHANVGINAGIGDDLLGRGLANAVNVGQGDLNALIAGKIDTNETCHVVPGSFLPSPDAAYGGDSRR